MPRAPRTVLLRLTLKTAERNRRCSRSMAHAVRPGEKIFLVREPGPAAGQKGYCSTCAAAMLDAAHDALDELHQALQITAATTSAAEET
jgi:hypothetical protein